MDMLASQKVCVICGDKALGYNFNAITCESCKAFFRRNALSEKNLLCPFNENCDITIITRRFCQKCRLKKCFRLGMKKELIMSEEDKRIKKRKIEQNRIKRQLCVTSNKEDIPKKFKKSSKLIASPQSDGGSRSSSTNLTSTELNNIYAIGESEENSSSFCSTHSEDSFDPSEIVNHITAIPENSTWVINKLMKSPRDALEIMTRVFESPSDALKLIQHLIECPGNALKIISKITNTPLDALTVFKKCMTCPSDAQEIVEKIMSSPKDVVYFIQQLINSPKEATDIMQEFLTSPADAVKKVNAMMNGRLQSLSAKTLPAKHICNSITSTLSTSPDTLSPISFDKEQETIKKELKTTTVLETNHANSNSKKSTTDDTKTILEDVEDRPIQPNSIESVLCEAIKLEYETLKSLPFMPGDSRELNEAEQTKLDELISASKALYYPLDDDISCLHGEDERIKCDESQQDPQLLKVINLTAVAIRRLIKMSKKISAFRNMCQEDQVALLKGGCTEMMIMRSVMSYDCDHATWKIPHSKENMSNIKVDILKLAKGNVYEEHERFIQTFQPKWRMDENIILIMCAILLFKPTRPRVIHSDVIKLEQNSYFYLLRRYLESVFPGCEAKSTFIKLIQKISEVERLNELIIGVYLDVNPSQVEPLLREIFDLKNH